MDMAQTCQQGLNGTAKTVVDCALQVGVRTLHGRYGRAQAGALRFEPAGSGVMNIHTPKTPMQMTSPDPGDTRPLRDAFARFATGVTVITARSSLGPLAMTANSFTSVSLDPPLVLWCAARRSRRYEAFAGAEHYAIHVLAADQAPLADIFAKDGLALQDVAHDVNAQNVPVLRTCLARFDCKRRDVHRAGDHGLIIGEVLAAGQRAGDALTFFSGAMGRLSPE